MDAKDCDWVITTWRDPLRVAASWANRGRWGREAWYRRWREQWGAYGKLLECKPTIFDCTKGQYQHGETLGPVPLNQSADNLGLHKSLNDGNYDLYYSIIDKHLIDFVYDQIGDGEPVSGIKPF